jgi:hypothetical protein
VALDSGHYEPFLIVDRSVSVVASPGVYAEIQADGGASGAEIYAGGETIVLRGLAFKGGPKSAHGIDIHTGGSIHVENCVIGGFQGNGINYSALSGELVVTDTISRENSNGVYVSGTSKDGKTSARGSIERSRVNGNYGDGIVAVGYAKVTVRDSLVTGSARHGFSATGPAPDPAGSARSGNAAIVVENCTSTQNAGYGVSAGQSSEIYVSNSTLTFNNLGFFSESGGVVYTRLNNTVEENVYGPGTAIKFTAK